MFKKKTINWIFLLLLICLSHFMYAEIKVWGQKGRVNIKRDDTGKIIKIKLLKPDSYLALIQINDRTHKILELKGKQKKSYEELVKLFEEAPGLLINQFIENAITKIERPVYRGCRCIGGGLSINPFDIKKLCIGTNDTFSVIWQKTGHFDIQKHNPILRLINLYNEILYEHRLHDNEFRIQVPTEVYSQDGEFLILQIITDGNERESESSKRVMVNDIRRQSQRKRIGSILLPEYEESLAYQLYALLIAYDDENYIEGLKLFEKIEKDLQKYEGFKNYYKPLYMYYIKEEYINDTKR